MPPRKRAASAPKDDPEATVDTVGDQEGGDRSAGEPNDHEPDSDPADEGPADPGEPPAPDGTAPDPERSDLQTVDAPCATCFPSGWPDQAYAVGCTHGTWQREATG